MSYKTHIKIEKENWLKVPVYVFKTVQDFGGWVALGCPDVDVKHVLVWKFGKPGTYAVKSEPIVVRPQMGQLPREVYFRQYDSPQWIESDGLQYIMWAVVTHRQDSTINPFNVIRSL